MQQLEFFLLGLLVVWLTGTGKLAALWQALKSTPGASGPTNVPQAPDNPNPPAPQGSTPGTVYTGPDGKLYVVGPDGQPLAIEG